MCETQRLELNLLIELEKEAHKTVCNTPISFDGGNAYLKAQYCHAAILDRIDNFLAKIKGGAKLTNYPILENLN